MTNGTSDDMPDWAPPLEDYEVPVEDAPVPDSTDAPATPSGNGADDSAGDSTETSGTD
jgi:hypothetical protein